MQQSSSNHSWVWNLIIVYVLIILHISSHSVYNIGSLLVGSQHHILFSNSFLHLSFLNFLLASLPNTIKEVLLALLDLVIFPGLFLFQSILLKIHLKLSLLIVILSQLSLLFSCSEHLNSPMLCNRTHLLLLLFHGFFLFLMLLFGLRLVLVNGSGWFT